MKRRLRNASNFISCEYFIGKIDFSWISFFTMLSDTCVKQQNRIGKIFKNSKFHFFQIEPKLSKTNLEDLKNLRKIILSDLHAILEQNRILNSKTFKNSQNIKKSHIFENSIVGL